MGTTEVVSLVGGHGAIGEDEAGHALARDVVDEVLRPGEVNFGPAHCLSRSARLRCVPAVGGDPELVLKCEGSGGVFSAGFDLGGHEG